MKALFYAGLQGGVRTPAMRWGHRTSYAVGLHKYSARVRNIYVELNCMLA